MMIIIFFYDYFELLIMKKFIILELESKI
jgi:hypothetical protein